MNKSRHFSRELSLHPVHLKKDNDGNLPPSALVPFCFYQGDSIPPGYGNQGLQNLTICDKFEPTFLEGQICYTLDTAAYEGKPTKTGKDSGLLLLLDPNPYEIKSIYGNVKAKRNDEESFKVYIHTLSEHTAFGPGAYALHTLKRMAGTPRFYQLPDVQKECQIHSRESCQTEKFLNQVKDNCKCILRTPTIQTIDMKV